MNSVYIYHHLGLGDHMICHGIVREYAARYAQVFLFCKPHNLITVQAMFKDLNLIYIPADDTQVINFISVNPNLNYKLIGFSSLNNNTSFDKQFYNLAGVPFEYRRTKFFCPSSANSHNLMQLKTANLQGAKYAVVHDDIARGYAIDRSRINLPIVDVTPEPGFSLTHYHDIIKNAEEIHVIDSSVMFFVDYQPALYKAGNMFVHRYARPNPEWTLPVLCDAWTILQ